MSLNKVLILGNLTRDPELRTTTSGQNVCSFGVATNRVWNDQKGVKQEQVEYHSVVAWGRLAEIAGQYLAKGRKVFIEGRLQTREWEGQDAVKRSRTEIIAENLQILDRAPGAGAPGAPRPAASPGTPPSSESQHVPPTDENGDEGIKIEAIPF